MKVNRYVLSALILLAANSLAYGADPETEHFGRFGTVTLYRETPHPGHVVLFISGDGGWNKGVVDMARELASLDALVVGIDIRTYLQALDKSGDACLYPAWDLVALSQYIQKKLDFPSYHIPSLVGYSSGATLTYAVLAQSSADTFQGGISLGFCPDLDVAKPFCRSHGLTSTANPKSSGILFNPVKEISNPWVVFQGAIDQVCDAAATEQFVHQVKGADLVLLPKVGHGYSVPKNWLPQLREKFRQMSASSVKTEKENEITAAKSASTAAEAPGISDLPLIEVPASGAPTDTMAFIASGDGGWASLDKQVAGVLASEGIPVVGMDTLQYYWHPHPPEESARALERILRHYLAIWGKHKVLLIGYSFGADVLPFMASRLPAELKARVGMIALIGPGIDTSFEFHIGDWLGKERADAVAIQPELEKLRGQTILCIYGAKESQSLCPLLPEGLARLDKRPGRHHLGGAYKAIAAKILAESGH